MSQLKGRILRALVAPPASDADAQRGALIVDRDADADWLLTPAGVPLVLVDAESLDRAALRARLERVMKQHRKGLMHVAVVGGDDAAVRPALKRARPFWQLQRQFALHRIHPNGRYERIDGNTLAALKLAVERASLFEPLTGEEALAAKEAGAAEVASDRRFDQALAGTPWVTIAIAVVCVGLFGLGLEFGNGSTLTVLRMGANRGRAIAFAHPWLLLSSAFLHHNFEHLLLNMAALFSFGPLLERVLGARRYLVLYVLSALGGGLASALGHDDVVSVGASGALWGLMVGGGGLVLRPRGLLPPRMLERMKKQVWAPVAINLVYSLQPGIDIMAHLGGGVTGLVLFVTGAVTLGLPPVGERRQAPSPGASFASLVCAGAAIASILVAIGLGRPWELRTPPTVARQAVGQTGISFEAPGGLIANKDGPQAIGFGNLLRDPIAVEVVYGEEGRPILPGEEASLRASLLKELDSSSVPGTKRVGKVRQESIGGRMMIRRDSTFSLGSGATYGLPLFDRWVVLTVYEHSDAPRAWRGLGDRIAASLADEGVPRLERACAARDASACIRAAVCREAGVTVAKDPLAAQQLLKRACEAGSAAACREPGVADAK
jgi:membrane associated rhomboid family serine protease